MENRLLLVRLISSLGYSLFIHERIMIIFHRRRDNRSLNTYKFHCIMKVVKHIPISLKFSEIIKLLDWRYFLKKRINDLSHVADTQPPAATTPSNYQVVTGTNGKALTNTDGSPVTVTGVFSAAYSLSLMATLLALITTFKAVYNWFCAAQRIFWDGWSILRPI